QNHRVAQRGKDLVYRLVDERRGVVNDLVIESFGETSFQLLHLRFDTGSGFQSIGARQLVDRQSHGGFAVQGAGLIVLLRATFDLRIAVFVAGNHVAQPDDAGGTERRSFLGGGGALRSLRVLAVRTALVGGRRGAAAARGRLDQRPARRGLEDDIGEFFRLGE